MTKSLETFKIGSRFMDGGDFVHGVLDPGLQLVNQVYT